MIKYLLHMIKVLVIYISIGVLSTAAIADTATYRINPGDVLQVFVWNEDVLSGEVMVQPDGLIRFPMVGQVIAGGYTPAEIEAQIISGLKRYLKDEPVVTASLRSIQGNKIYVIGNVTRPGEYVINSQVDVMQALALAGGLTSFAAENDIRILRRNDTGEASSVKFSYARVKQGKDLEANVILQSGNTIVVP